MKKIVLAGILLIYGSSYGQSSQSLSYLQAVEKVLENNYSIRLVKIDQAMRKAENHPGAAGMLPTINLASNGNVANNATRQEFSSGLVVDKDGVSSTGINAGAYLNWTLFDGFKMFAIKGRLQKEVELSDATLRNQIEQSIQETALLYFKIVMQDQIIKGFQSDYEISLLQLTLAEKKSEIGSGDLRSLLLAKTEMNRVRTSILSQEKIQIDNWKALCQLMQEENKQQYHTEASYQFQPPSVLEDALNKASSQNTQLGLLRILEGKQKLYLRELKAAYFPTFGVGAQYQFMRNQSAAGFSLLNQNIGLTMGYTLSWTIFNGFTARQRIESARLGMKRIQLQQEQLVFQNTTELHSLYEKWKKDTEIVKLEEEAMEWAKQHLDITSERMRVGISNDLEIKQSQNAFEETLVRMANAQYNKKMTEIAILRILGELK